MPKNHANVKPATVTATDPVFSPMLPPCTHNYTVERDTIKPVRNLYKVPQKQWRKWSNKARSVFNALYQSMTKSPDFFQHTKQKPPTKEHWKVTAWNAAWIAADAAM